jgi:hypothetical protein
MAFDRKYELLEPLPEPLCRLGVRLKAREISSGRPVTIHVVPERDQAENEALLRDIRTFPLDEQRRVVEIGGYARAAYVVTEELQGDPLLQTWVASVKARIAAEKPVPPVEIPQEPGEFTRLFQGLDSSKPQATAQADSGPGEFTKLFQAGKPIAAQPPKALPGEPAVEPPSSGPGEFTSLFQGLSSKPETPVPAEQPKPVSEPALKPPPTGPGEFTRLFQGLGASGPETPAPVEQPKPAPPAGAPPPALGEFESLFQASPQESNTGRNACATPGEFTKLFQGTGQPPAPSNQTEPGEFTKMFQSPLSPAPGKLRFPSQPSAPAPPAATPREPDGFTRMLESPLVSQEFGGPALRPAPLPIPNPTPGAVPATGAPAAEEGPSEYTRIFNTPPKRPTPAPAPAAKPKTNARPPIPKRKKRSSWPLVLLVVAVLIVVIGAVVFWATRG